MYHYDTLSLFLSVSVVFFFYRNAVKFLSVTLRYILAVLR